MISPYPASALQLLLSIARHGGWMTWEDIRALAGGAKAPRSLADDLTALVNGGTIQVRGSLDAAGLAAERTEAMRRIEAAQRDGSTVMWRSAQVFSYALSPAGADIANLLAQMPANRRG
jgi:hypothetical protein